MRPKPADIYEAQRAAARLVRAAEWGIANAPAEELAAAEEAAAGDQSARQWMIAAQISATWGDSCPRGKCDKGCLRCAQRRAWAAALRSLRRENP